MSFFGWFLDGKEENQVCWSFLKRHAADTMGLWNSSVLVMLKTGYVDGFYLPYYGSIMHFCYHVIDPARSCSR